MAKAKDIKDNAPSTFGARQNVKTPGDEEQEKVASLLKKSDLSVILIGAGVITVIVFLMFFRPDKDETIDLAASKVDIQSLEERVKILEGLVSRQEAASGTLENATSPSLESYRARVERVEAALSMKFDLVASRLSILEKKIDGFDQRMEAKVKVSPGPKAVAVKKPPVKKAVSKAVPKKAEANAIIHKVKKGETLYGISRQYKTTVAKLRSLNKLTDKAGIFPGDNLVVK